MRMVGTQLEEEFLLFGEGAWAGGLSVLDGQNARLLAPRCGAPFWTPLLGKKEKAFSRAVCRSCIHFLPSGASCHPSLPWNCAWLDSPQPPYCQLQWTFWSSCCSTGHYSLGVSDTPRPCPVLALSCSGLSFVLFCQLLLLLWSPSCRSCSRLGPGPSSSFCVLPLSRSISNIPA